MAKIKIISTLLEDNSKKYVKNIYLGDFATSLENYEKSEKFSSDKLFKEKRKKLLNKNKKIINIFYQEYKNFYNFKISKKSFSLIVSPFIFTFLDVIRNKYNSLSSCRKKFKSSQFSSLHKTNFIYPKNFSEFLSKIQSDQFNLQLNTEIIVYKKFNNEIIQLKNPIKNKVSNFLKKLIKLNKLKKKKKL